MRKTILTGIRANNDLHIGNYFGAMLPIVDMAKTRSSEYDVNFFIPDLHSFTTPIDHSQLFDSIMNNARIYTAAGLPLDNENIHIYRQSYVPAHSELTIILNNFVGMGEMERMTQYKDKSAKLGSDRVSVGLFDYPVLMASDILLYNAKYVPVGDDQTQHLEITRDIAERMNNKFNTELFAIPEPVVKQHEFFGKDQGLRIKDLLDPSKKMSKSDETGKGVVFLSDEPELAHKKIMSAATDDKANIQYDKVNQPGIANLIDILALLRGVRPADVEAEFKGSQRYGDFKQVVADEMAAFLRDFQQRLASVDDAAIIAKLEASERAMNEIANQTLLRVQKAVGLRK
ncbi:tryptophan--tRNA ligase [Candidatus Saccharibacteria bacterium]|nr:MAG: tryptophan--tRNA ligase [Candidatus Saccharibacteria bacterium]